MRKWQSSVSLIVVLFATPLIVQAKGGGGIECLTNVGTERLAGDLLDGTPLFVPYTGSVDAVSGYGYTIGPRGFKLGGFGTIFRAVWVPAVVEGLGSIPGDAAGGFGGVILGGQARRRSFALALNTRLGVGGIGVSYKSFGEWGELERVLVGTVALYGTADLEVGVVTKRRSMISVFAGVQALAAITADSFIPAAVPSLGIRVTWGEL